MILNNSSVSSPCRTCFERGMGGDGGVFVSRADFVNYSKGNKKNKIVNDFKYCPLSGDLLSSPIVACKQGHLYNKESVLKYLLSGLKNYHLTSLKEVKELKIKFKNTEKNMDIVCPITGASIGHVESFVFLWSCGCVFSKKALEYVKDGTCLICGKRFSTNDIFELKKNATNQLQVERKCTGIKSKQDLPINPEPPI